MESPRTGTAGGRYGALKRVRPGAAADRIGREAHQSECAAGGRYGALKRVHQSECAAGGRYGALKIVTLAASLCVLCTAHADVVTMKDGRVLEGEILGGGDGTVMLDTMVSPTIRTTLRLDRAQIDDIERKPLEPGYFDPPPPAARVSKAEDFDPRAKLYIEVPIIGRFGTDVFADGVLAAIRYAHRYRIEHIVFLIDSTGGSYEEARAIYEHLRKYDRALTYHALVHDCLDGALAVAVWCDTVSVVPGAQIGGTARIGPDSAEEGSDVVMRAQIAREIAAEAERRGRRGVVIRAMIDPLQEVVAWRGADGGIEVAERAPEGLRAQDILFRAGPRETLILNYKQALRVGLPAFEGSPNDLGAVLELEGWTRESDYGAQAMAETVARKRNEASDEAAVYAQRVSKNISRREMAERYVDESLRQAAEWSPTNDTYETYGRRWRWGWRDGVSHSNTWTNESRRRWQNRSDATMYYLRESARGIRTMSDLEKEAAELRLEPMMAPGELQTMARDVQMKYDYLAANRNRRGN